MPSYALSYWADKLTLWSPLVTRQPHTIFIISKRNLSEKSVIYPPSSMVQTSGHWCFGTDQSACIRDWRTKTVEISRGVTKMAAELFCLQWEQDPMKPLLSSSLLKIQQSYSVISVTILNNALTYLTSTKWKKNKYLQGRSCCFNAERMLLCLLK